MKKEITGYSDYFVTDEGIVISSKYGKRRVLKQRVNSKGYLCVNLSNNGKITTRAVHRLVAEAFLENTQSLPMINHKDGNKFNNHIDNLEWCTALHNSREAVRLGLIKGKKLLSHEEADKIKDMYLKSNMSQRKFSSRFSISRFTLSRILKDMYYH